MISMLALLILFGAGGLALAAVIFGLTSKGLWFIPVAGLVLVFMLGAGGLMFGIVAPSMHWDTMYQISSSTPVPEHMGVTNQTFETAPPLVFHPDLPMWASGMRWSVILGAILLVLLVRRVAGSHHPHGFWRAWPIIVLAGFIGFLFLTRITVSTSYHPEEVNAQAARQTADPIAAQQQILKSQEQLRIKQNKLEAAARQQILQQHPNAHFVAQSSAVKSAQTGDIHELMDKFDAPQIPVPDASAPPNAPVAPTVPAPVAAGPSAPSPVATVAVSDTKSTPTDDSAPSSENKKDSASKSGGDKHKKSKTKPANDAKPTAGAVARSAPLAQPAAKPENSKPEKNKPSDNAVASAAAKPATSAPRPTWIDESPKRTGSTRREVISTEQYETVDECYQAADVYLLLKTYERLQQLAGQTMSDGPLPSITFQNGAVLGDGKVMCYGRGAALWNGPDTRLRSIGEMGITADYLRREIVAKDPTNNESCEYIETVERTFGPMKRLYLQLEFTPAIDRQLMTFWNARLRNQRFAAVGFGAGSLLGLLACAFVLLKIDTWTKGYYSKRLFIGVPTAIIGTMFLLYFLVGQH